MLYPQYSVLRLAFFTNKYLSEAATPSDVEKYWIVMIYLDTLTAMSISKLYN